tara:strand:+ start:43 stop:450 length:408 start_codon:yes stop_codon:yes gene_type:complete
MEEKSKGLDAGLLAESLNQKIFENEYVPNMSIAQNFEKIIDAARNKDIYKSKDFDRLGLASATRIKRFTIGDSNKPIGMKLKPSIGLSLQEISEQYDSPLIGNYDAKNHLIKFLMEQNLKNTEFIPNPNQDRKMF